MTITNIKVEVVGFYNYLVSLLPVKLANQLLVVDRQMNWSISIYEGQNFQQLKPSSIVQNPVLSRQDVTDAVAVFVADPFMIRTQDNWLMFFEIFNQQQDKGELAFARSRDGYKWDYQHKILSEDFHLSYPYVFESEANWYMIPESCEAKSIRLYQAKQFPSKWEFVKEILVGERFVDASIINFNGIWWLFVGVEPKNGNSCNELRLYYADHLLDDWIEHPMSPIVSNNQEISRPAGRMRQLGDQLIRFTQDCSVAYGYNVQAIQIEVLTKTEYREAKIPTDQHYLFELGTMSCNHLGMHHIDFTMLQDDHCIACVDSR
jgi:hypothetical protein